jgi:ParB family chromosome partitioning protein
MEDQIQNIPLAAIVISTLNTRKNLEAGSEDAGIKNLADSIASLGLLQPPGLRALPDGTYEVIWGQRRVLACQQLGMASIPAVITDRADNEALGASIVENLQRADMHPLDKARGLDDLSKRLGSERETAKVTGLGVQTIKKYIALLSLPEDLRDQLGTGQGPSGVGAMSALARQFGDDEDSARDAWRLVEGFSGGTAETILNQSGGDMDRLEELREDALEGRFNVQRCGTSLSTCPWFIELPKSTQDGVLSLLKL